MKSAAKADPTITPAQLALFMAFLRTGTVPSSKPESPPDTTPRLIRRAEVGHRLSCSLRTVDKLPLKKVKLPGRQRAAGFLESDVNALLA